MKVHFRVLAVLLSLVLLVCSLAVPALADDYDSEFGINLLDYVFPNNGNSNLVAVKPDGFVYFDIPNQTAISYIDFVVQVTIADFTSCVCHINSTSGTSFNLNVVYLGSNLYRVYGNLNKYAPTRIYLDFGLAKTGYFTWLSFNVYATSATTFTDTATIDGSIGNDYDFALTWTSGNGIKTAYHKPSTAQEPFIVYVECPNWRKYDYLDYQLMFTVGEIDSISAIYGSKVIPINYAYVDTGSMYGDYVYVTIHIDLTTIDRSVSDYPMVIVTGMCTGEINYISLVSCAGVVKTSSPSPLLIIQNKLSSWFGNLQSWLSSGFQSIVDTLNNIFLSNSDAENALQTQEQVNQNINIQVQSAISQWDSHIDTVEGGYQSGLLGAVPALAWLGGLAENIFSSMDWFKNIYFMIALVSVLMLILSKSGLARDISHKSNSNK